MTEFEVSVATKGQNQTIRVFLSAEMQEFSESLTLTLHSQQNPFFLYTARITNANLAELIKNNTSTELQILSVKQIVFEQILPAIGTPQTTNGDIATFDGKILEFSSKRGTMKIPYFSIEFEAAAEKELAEHVYRLNQAEISMLKEQLEKKDEVCQSFELKIKDQGLELQNMSAKINEMSKMNTQLQMEIEESKNQESEGAHELRLEVESLRLQLNELMEKSEKDDRELAVLRSQKDALEKAQNTFESRALGALRENNVVLERQLQQANTEKMNLENRVHGLQDQIEKYEALAGPKSWEERKEAAMQIQQQNPFAWPREDVSQASQYVAQTPVSEPSQALSRYSQSNAPPLSAQTQSILQKYSKNPAIQSILQNRTQTANPFLRQQSETPVSNEEDMHISNLQTSSASIKPYGRPLSAAPPVKQSNLSNSTLALMQKYLKK